MTFSIRLQKQKTYKVNTRIGGVELPARFGDLEDFNIDTTKGNNYVMVYNATTQKFELADPDTVLSNSLSDGVPADVIDTLETDLDNKIDLDGGEF
jgi:hypothetical protein